MSRNPVEQLRDRAASHAAVAQYRKAARLHNAAAAEMMTSGWFNWAGESFAIASRLERAAEAEGMGPTGVPGPGRGLAGRPQ